VYRVRWGCFAAPQIPRILSKVYSRTHVHAPCRIDADRKCEGRLPKRLHFAQYFRALRPALGPAVLIIPPPPTLPAVTAAPAATLRIFGVRITGSKLTPRGHGRTRELGKRGAPSRPTPRCLLLLGRRRSRRRSCPRLPPPRPLCDPVCPAPFVICGSVGRLPS
jgi:hypothetical protein